MLFKSKYCTTLAVASCLILSVNTTNCSLKRIGASFAQGFAAGSGGLAGMHFSSYIVPQIPPLQITLTVASTLVFGYASQQAVTEILLINRHTQKSSSDWENVSGITGWLLGICAGAKAIDVLVHRFQ